ncbi:MAG: hypothetical protein ACLRVU_01360 [Beduini sp.]|uniref:hypothetical protein n=1 Tax=Beduini sp. TaxID=1922300 RepID=UPI0039A09630
MDKQQKHKVVTLIVTIMSFVSFFLLDVPSIFEKYFLPEEKVGTEKVPRKIEEIDKNNNIRNIKRAEGESPEQIITQNSTQEKENFLNNIIKQAQVVFNSEGYENAILVLKDAIKNYPGENILLQELKKYEYYRPIPISEFPQLKNTANGVEDKTLINKYKEDKFNNTYLYSFSLSRGTVTYFLDGKFSLIKGTIACPKEIKFDNYRKSSTITIIVDGQRKFISNPVEVDTYLQVFEIDLTGANTIEITWECEGGNIWENLGYYATLFDTYFYK